MKPSPGGAAILAFCLLVDSASSEQYPLLNFNDPRLETASPIPNAAASSLDSTPSLKPASPSFNTANPSFHTANPSLITVSPSLLPIGAGPSFGAPNQLPLGLFGPGRSDCAVVVATSIPGCARDCFTAGAAALGCSVRDLACQCRQQAHMMAAAEGCVAEACPGAAYQRVIDGAMAMCDCAVGVATAELTAMLVRPGPSASISGSFMSGSYSFMSGSYSLTPSLTVGSVTATATATHTVGRVVKRDSQPTGQPALAAAGVQVGGGNGGLGAIAHWRNIIVAAGVAVAAAL